MGSTKLLRSIIYLWACSGEGCTRLLHSFLQLFFYLVYDEEMPLLFCALERLTRLGEQRFCLREINLSLAHRYQVFHDVQVLLYLCHERQGESRFNRLFRAAGQARVMTRAACRGQLCWLEHSDRHRAVAGDAVGAAPRFTKLSIVYALLKELPFGAVAAPARLGQPREVERAFWIARRAHSLMGLLTLRFRRISTVTILTRYASPRMRRPFPISERVPYSHGQPAMATDTRII